MADTRSNRRSWNDPQLDDARVGVQVTGFWRPWQPTDSCSVAALDGHMYFNDQSAPERSRNFLVPWPHKVSPRIAQRGVRYDRRTLGPSEPASHAPATY